MSIDVRHLPDDMRSQIRFDICWQPELDPLCWLWSGPVSNKGYGIYRCRAVTTHKLAYELLVGKVPAGLTLDHLCRRITCLNPRHLEPVTRAVNNERAALARRNPPIDSAEEYSRYQQRQAVDAMGRILTGIWSGRA
ncbi:HNH endonuclease [Mycobacterium asiaticum]|uniref:HNH endonuclease n=1 Tax=Mycobacterium asiaticum TaxID=1790 RepID=UPI0007EFD4DC|nr:HNH endonuclease [Mycobacterium asiaticum]OBJ60054.1 hypothetical protein A9W94_14080 [Mycobacterium asiaticum]